MGRTTRPRRSLLGLRWAAAWAYLRRPAAGLTSSHFKLPLCSVSCSTLFHCYSPATSCKFILDIFHEFSVHFMTRAVMSRKSSWPFQHLLFGEVAGRRPPARCCHAECSPASRPCAMEDFIALLGWKRSGCMQIHSLNQKDMIFAGTALATEAMVSSTRFGFKKVFWSLLFQFRKAFPMVPAVLRFTAETLALFDVGCGSRERWLVFESREDGKVQLYRVRLASRPSTAAESWCCDKWILVSTCNNFPGDA